MIDPLQASMKAAGSGLAAQSARMQVAAENLANANSTAGVPGGDPYTRKTISFAADQDEATGADVVIVDQIGRHAAPFELEYSPGHPGADAQGYVKRPNVNPLVEMADMREANRSYLANLQMVRQAREAISMTIDLLRNQ